MLDRASILERNCVRTNRAQSILQVGNGEFACGVDATGLQTFGGGIFSHWGWHSFPLPPGRAWDDIPRDGTFEAGRLQGPQIWPEDKKDIEKWLYQNPHMLALGRFSLRMDEKDVRPGDLTEVWRVLDIRSGIHTSSFCLNGSLYETESCVGDADTFQYTIKTTAAEAFVVLSFAYPEKLALRSEDAGQKNAARHQTECTIRQQEHTVIVRRNLDEAEYYVCIWAEGCRIVAEPERHTIAFMPTEETMCLRARFSLNLSVFPDEQDNHAQSAARMQAYWEQGAMLDLSESADPRWRELERRIVLSQYLMAVNSTGSLPSGESGLFKMDVWNGKFHMEMIFWHIAHFAAWNRLSYFCPAAQFYRNHQEQAAALAAQLGYKGLMWPKMTGPEGRNSPWYGNNILQWKQPHAILLAELEYAAAPSRDTLDNWRDVVFGTADFMADYVNWNREKGWYDLEPIMCANELAEGRNPAFELAYWYWGLDMALQWKERLGEAGNKKWVRVRDHLAPLPEAKGAYVTIDGWEDNYSDPQKSRQHPDPIGVFAFLPLTPKVVREKCAATLDGVLSSWKWDDTWGWDFPWIAMAAARLGRMEEAIEALLQDASKNIYDEAGVNNGWYLPGNGGLLYAMAMLCTRKKGDCLTIGKEWRIRHEGFITVP